MKKHILIILLFFCTTALCQSDSVTVTRKITVNTARTFYLVQTSIFPDEKFTALGLTLPIFTNWKLGFPFIRFEQSLYLYTQRRENLNWYSRITIPFVVYDLPNIDIPYNNGNAEIFVTGTYFFKPEIIDGKVEKKVIIARSESANYFTKIKIPKKTRRGINFGYFASNQFALEDFSVLHHGLIIGYSQKKAVIIKSKISPDYANSEFTTKETYSPTYKKLYRIFYSNINISLNTSFLDAQFSIIENVNLSYVPLGFNIGWLMMNKRTSKKAFTAWNLEFGLKGPVFYNVSAQYDRTFPWFHFTYRGFLGGMFPKKYK